MADADEDAFPVGGPSSSAASASRTLQLPDSDPTEEAQDFRFLAALSKTAGTVSDDASTDFSIPRRGEKEFEPLPLASQNAALDASRAAMHSALSAPRVHTGKSHLVGIFLEDEDEQGKMEGRCVRIDIFKGTLGKTMGRADASNRSWLWPEEALFLVERGSLDVRWPEGNGDLDKTERIEPSREDGVKEEEDEADKVQDSKRVGIPMSLQAAYACFLGRSGLTLERYLVFSGLRRLGYVVTRAPTWHDEDVGSNGHARPPESTQLTVSTSQTHKQPSNGLVGILARWLQGLFAPKRGVACPSLGPLVAPGLYRNYNDIFRALTLVPYYDSSSPRSGLVTPKAQPKPPFRIAYNVYKPGTNFRKTAPPEPDFRIAVIDARSTSVPTVQQIGTLLDSVPDDVLPKDKRLEQRLKHGKKNAILAVVDSGVVSYLRLSESGFGSVKLFEERTARGGKKGGYRGKGKGKAR